MPYQYLAWKLRRPVASHLEIDAALCDSMGTLDDIRSAIAGVFPEVQWLAAYDREIGVVDSAGARLELRIGLGADPRGPTISIHASLHARAAAEIQRLCNGTGWTAMDMQTCALIAPRTSR